MFIKSIILNGFKSYGTETEITGFDRRFNAITGLNGSGKSNILDAICFVLGLSRMEIARCNTLSELVYKTGSAGITKASVTIKFDNRDKSQSPPAYKDYEEIIVRREVNVNSRSKYWINGLTHNSQSVADLFQSVSLNIQNPHFLIMQGRITKVLNMKPHEILSMVEEATGVSMYERKKEKTQTTIFKKDSALKEIDSLITETIVPNLEQLKKQQSGLMEYQKVTAELESMNKVLIAFNFTREEENCLKVSSKVEDKNREIEKHLEDKSNAESEAKQIEGKIKASEKKKDEEFGGKLSELEAVLKEEQLTEAKLLGELNYSSETLKGEEKKMDQFTKNLEGDRRITASKQKQFDSLNDKLISLKEDNELKEEALKKAEKDFEDISAGKSRALDGQAAATLADQLMSAEKEVANSETEIRKTEMKLKQSKSDLNKKETEVKKVSKNYDKDMNEINSMNSDVEALRDQLQGIGFDEQKHSDLRSSLHQTKGEINELSNQISSAESHVSRVRFDYRDPHPNFDRNSVIGVVCNLFSIKNMDYALALEKAAGGKLYNVVVDNEQTGKALLDRGQLRERRTLIPLDRIRGIDADTRALRKAQDIVGRDNVDYAINYVNYDSRLSQTMKYVFGDTLIVPNMEIAKRIVYAPGVQKVTVTYDGEVFEPSGTLSGGSAAQGVQVLAKVAEIVNKRQQLEELKNRFNQMESEVKQLDRDFNSYSKLKQNYDLKAREAELVRQRLQQGNSAHILMQEIQDLKETIETDEQILIKCEEIKKTNSKRIQELNLKMKDSKNTKERERKEAEQMLKTARTQAEKSRKVMADDLQKVDCLRLEIQELTKAMDSCEEQLKEFTNNINKMRTEVDTNEQKVNEVKERVSQLNARVKEQKKILKSHSEEISKMQRQKESVLKRGTESELKVKQINYEIEKMKNSSKESAQTVKHMKKKYNWIQSDKHLFGNESAGYGFDVFSEEKGSEKMKKRLDGLKAKKTALSKTVNMRANIELSDKEKQLEELTKKRKIVSNDKLKLIQYMSEVDREKNTALKEAHQKINADFGSIFSTFLPNSNAKLEAPEGKSVTDGLEVKVAFGDVWKDSLTELSGGQRSLVALSLILALLKFNPAPLYILDEVDAALDQSHTQNTGIMIRKHFTNSQFVIVSLKDDMFNNANVLFKTKFVDGTSHVTRLSKDK